MRKATSVQSNVMKQRKKGNKVARHRVKQRGDEHARQQGDEHAKQQGDECVRQ